MSAARDPWSPPGKLEQLPEQRLEHMSQMTALHPKDTQLSRPAWTVWHPRLEGTGLLI